MKTKTGIVWLLLLFGLLVLPGYAIDSLEDMPPADYAALFDAEAEHSAVQAAPQKQETILKAVHW